MAPSRRRLLLLAASVPVAGVLARLAGPLAALAPFSRPGPRGSSATVCASCGAADHGMLDAGCPNAPRVAMRS